MLPEIGMLADLTLLDVTSNQIGALPPEIGNLTNLTFLYVGNNLFSILPLELGGLQNLACYLTLDFLTVDRRATR
ncbi:MAG: hypothetical protein R2873_03395 [Caldilineaceae bacterium]